MGIAGSTASNYLNSKYVMSAENEIDFRFDQIDWIEQAKSWGRAEALSQAAQTGLIGGGGIGGGPNTFGWGYGFWRNVNWGMYGMALFFVPLALIAIVAGYFVGFSPEIMFALFWIFFTFSSHHVLYNTRFGQTMTLYSSIPLWTIIGGLIVAAILAWGVWGPLVYNKDSQSKESKIVIGSFAGVAGFMLLVYVVLGAFRYKFTTPSQTQGFAMTGGR